MNRELLLLGLTILAFILTYCLVMEVFTRWFGEPNNTIGCLGSDDTRGVRGDSRMKFPDEATKSAAVQADHAKAFELAEQMLDYWVALSKGALTDSTLPAHAVELALIMDIQAIRQFRTALEECKRCEASCAAIIARSLFETAMALMFVLKTDVRIKLVADVKNGNTKYRAQPSKDEADLLSVETRANLYLLHVAYDSRRMLEKFANVSKKTGGDVAAPLDPENEAAITRREVSLPLGWADTLKQKKKYSGLRIDELAGALDDGFALWYEAVYGDQCRIVHGSDALQHADEDGEQIVPLFHSPSEDVGRVLMVSLFLFRVCVSTLEEYVGFGPDVKAAVERFGTRYDELYS